jgi:zinc resistance-associated protein
MTSRLSVALAFAGLVSAGILVLAVKADAGEDADQSATTKQTEPPAQNADQFGTTEQTQLPRFVPTPADRAAFLDARIAALHAGLELTTDQDKLWPAVETALRNASKVVADQREKARSEPKPADPVAWLQRVSENALTRGEALKKLADAATPLYAALTDDQKHRLPILWRATHVLGWHRHFAMNESPRGGDEGWRERGGGQDFDRDRDDNDGRGDSGDPDQR